MNLSQIPGFWDDVPKLDAKGRAWARRQIARWIAGRPELTDTDPDRQIAGRVRDWYAERVTLYVGWTDEPKYLGAGYAAGHWSLRVDVLERDWQKAMGAVLDAASAAVAALRACLPPVPPADIDAALRELAEPGAYTPTEPAGAALRRKPAEGEP